MRPRIFRNFGLKVLSIALAALLWGLVAGQREAERALRIPLEYRNIPEHLELMGEPVSLVDVRVRGSSGALGELRGADLVAVLDLRSARSGRRLFHLVPGDIAVPSGVTVLQVTPSTIALVFEESAARTVPVVPDLDGEPAPGFVVGRVTTTPPMVDVVGPASAGQQIVEATTEPVNIGGATASVRDSVTIGLPDSVARLRTPQVGIVHVEIVPAPVERTLEKLGVKLRGLGRDQKGTLRPATVTVVVRGLPGSVERLTEADVEVYADLTGFANGRYNLPVKCQTPSGVTVVRVEPATLGVTIR
jgi:YbbR domain-containing protein